MNGFEFVTELRTGPHIPHPQTPVLILTGHSNPENLEQAVKLGINGFLAKPISKGLMESRISAAITSPPIDPNILKRG